MSKAQTLSGKRELLQAAQGRLRVIAEGLGAADALDELALAQRRLTETTFRLVVLGEYKRGKSTLINALLGRPVLPMGVVPLTSVVTELHYRDEPGVTIEFLDGRSLDIARDDLPQYVTEPGNPHNRKRVRRAIIHDTAPLLREGAIVVDTPGVGSVFQHNSDATYQFLEEADAVVVVLAADQPLSSEELELLRALRGITDRILVVVNRVDILTDAETEASVGFVRETLTTLEGYPPEMVFPLSARLALESRARPGLAPDHLVAFERVLHEVLIGRKADILLARSRTLTLGAADLLSLRLSAERQGMNLAGDRLETATEAFRGAAAQIQERLDQSGLLLAHQVERIHSVELQRLGDETRTRLLAELWARIESALGARPAPPLRQQVEGLSAEIGQWVVEELRRHYHDTDELVHQGRASRRWWEKRSSRPTSFSGCELKSPERLCPFRSARVSTFAIGTIREGTWWATTGRCGCRDAGRSLTPGCGYASCSNAGSTRTSRLSAMTGQRGSMMPCAVSRHRAGTNSRPSSGWSARHSTEPNNCERVPTLRPAWRLSITSLQPSARSETA
jgi:GTPase SAR1 family protein